MFAEMRFRMFLRRQDTEASRFLLKNSDAFEEAFSNVHATYQKAMKGKSAGRLTDFFQWLLEHKEEILAIIALFG